MPLPLTRRTLGPRRVRPVHLQALPAPGPAAVNHLSTAAGIQTCAGAIALTGQAAMHSSGVSSMRATPLGRSRSSNPLCWTTMCRSISREAVDTGVSRRLLQTAQLMCHCSNGPAAGSSCSSSPAAPAAAPCGGSLAAAVKDSSNFLTAARSSAILAAKARSRSS
jgi:hypothetical protein